MHYLNKTCKMFDGLSRSKCQATIPGWHVDLGNTVVKIILSFENDSYYSIILLGIRLCAPRIQATWYILKLRIEQLSRLIKWLELCYFKNAI